jgi:hypothetical protein
VHSGHGTEQATTLADVPEFDMTRAPEPANYGTVAGAVVLWAILLLGLVSIAQGAIALIDLLIPSHHQAGGVALGLVDIAVGGLVGLPAVFQSKWFIRPANSASVERSWMPWVLWAIIVLGIGIVALGLVALLALLILHHPKPLSAAPDVLVIGLGGLICLGPTLRLRGFGLLISRRTQAPRSAELARPQTRSERARMQVAISGMVLLAVGVFVATASKASVGWAIAAALASAVAFGIPVSIALATQRRNGSLPVTTALLPPSLPLGATSGSDRKRVGALGMEQVLPLTQAMTEYAQSPVFRKGMGSVTSLVIFVLVLCFAAPASISFVMFLQHRPLGPGAAVVWVLFGLLACGLIYLGLQNARLIRRDLAGGVYVRWTGPFTTRVVQFGYYAPSKGFVVEAGGRTLGTEGGVLRLPPIGFNSGTVDYLPASNTLCEVRNEQGALLWSLFGTTGDSPEPASPQPG